MKWQHEVKNEKLGGDSGSEGDERRLLKRIRLDAPEIRLNAEGRRIFVCDVCNPEYHYYNEQSLKRHQMSALHLAKTASSTADGTTPAAPPTPVPVETPKGPKVEVRECLYPGCEEEFEERTALDEHVLHVHASYRPIGRVPHFTLLPQLRT
jgi:hypothetical protein